MKLMLDRGFEIVGGDGRGTEDVALCGLGSSSRGTKVTGRCRAALRGSRMRGAGHHGSGLDGHGLAHDGALLSLLDQTVGGHGSPGGLLREGAQGRWGGVAKERASL